MEREHPAGDLKAASEALVAIVRLLEPLKDEDKVRTLAAAAAYYGISAHLTWERK